MTRRATLLRSIVSAATALTLGVAAGRSADAPAPPPPPAPADFAAVRQHVATYCLGCHSAEKRKGGLDLERFATVEQVRQNIKPWLATVEQLEAGEMPPKDKPQPTPAERAAIIGWARGFLLEEARARAGDPGRLPVRRLSNAEYDATVRDLAGVDLRPAREFPADGAAGEGFANAAEALTDLSPTRLGKYFNAAKEVAAHAVLTPDGFRFSPSKARRDWTDEGTAKLRQLYARFATGDGRLPVQPYLLATVRHRDALRAGAFADVAAREKLNPKYLAALWAELTADDPSQPLADLRARWRSAGEADVPALAADVSAWQAALWRTVKVGNYIQATWGKADGSAYVESLTRQLAVDPPAVESATLRLAAKPTPGEPEVTIHLTAGETGPGGRVVWSRPRFEAAGKPPLLLRDYATFGPAYEIDSRVALAGSAKYLAAAVAVADGGATAEDVARRDGLDAKLLKNWVALLALPPRAKAGGAVAARAAIPLAPLDEKTPPNEKFPAVRGWRKRGTDLPVVLSNASDAVLQIPGRVSGHAVGVHPLPAEFVAVTWRSPVAGTVRVAVRVAHAHPACGNGVAWWLEHRAGGGATLLGEGELELGAAASPPAREVKVEKGDLLVLAVDPRNGEHSCDMTEVAFTVTEDAAPGRTWDLAADVAADIQTGNPHADKHGNADTWAFARGPAKPKSGAAAAAAVPPDSVLGRWRAAATDPARSAEAADLATRVEALLTGARPAKEKDSNRALFDKLAAADGPLLTGLEASRFARPRPEGRAFALPPDRFTDDALVTAPGEVLAVRLPAALLAAREFVVDARLDGPPGDRLVRPRVATTPPAADTRWDGPVLAAADGPAFKRLVAGNDRFRRVFPLYACFPAVVPTDEVVTLKLFHREDEPLKRLFLTDAEALQLDRLWAEHRFVSRQPVAEFDQLKQFMEYTTQDTPKAFQQFFVDRKPLFQRQADEFVKEEEAAAPRQLDALLAFADRAYRRPLGADESAKLRALYDGLRAKGLGHDEAFRGVLARVLVSPAFLMKVEQAPPGEKAGPVTDWELAARLSYFLWSSVPDEELRSLAAAGKLHEPDVLAAQTRRMLKDDRARALATEFGTQWIHVRGFDALAEKNEALFPTFDAKLRAALYEEAILLFQDAFAEGRPVASLLDADATFLNEPLAKHYGIPGVAGPQWRRVEGVRKYGRGGLLGLGSVLARQAGASRTSPVLRGNWVVETLLGEKLPPPPPDVPQLPDADDVAGLTMREMTRRHSAQPACAVCHVRIDPFGFALERYDAIGRLRDTEPDGRPVDTRARLRDGTAVDGVDGVREYLLKQKREVFTRVFARRLLGYALGRSTMLSDGPLVDEMVAAMGRPDGTITDAVLTIVRSQQFRTIRGRDYTGE